MCSEEVLNWYFLLMDKAAVSNRYMSRDTPEDSKQEGTDCYKALQWNLSNTDTLWHLKSVS